MKNVNKNLKIAIVLLLVLFSESTILGLINSNGDVNYLFLPLGIVPTYESIFTAKNGLEVRDYNYSWTSIYHERNDVTTFDLELDIELYSYSNKAFDCTAYTEKEQGGAQNVHSTYSIKQGLNNIEILRTDASTTDLTNFRVGLILENPYTNIYRWTMSKGGGDASYHQNSLNFDEHATIQTGFAFTASRSTNLNFLVPVVTNNCNIHYWLFYLSSKEMG